MRVAVEDENDHAPTFGSAHLSLEVPEGQDPQTLITLRASDPDVGANGQLQYRIVGENLSTPTNLAPMCPVLLLCPMSDSVSVLGFPFPSVMYSSFSFMHVSMSPSVSCASPAYFPLRLLLCFCFFSLSFLSLPVEQLFSNILVSRTFNILNLLNSLKFFFI